MLMRQKCSFPAQATAVLRNSPRSRCTTRPAELTYTHRVSEDKSRVCVMRTPYAALSALERTSWTASSRVLTPVSNRPSTRSTSALSTHFSNSDRTLSTFFSTANARVDACISHAKRRPTVLSSHCRRQHDCQESSTSAHSLRHAGGHTARAGAAHSLATCRVRPDLVVTTPYHRASAKACAGERRWGPCGQTTLGTERHRPQRPDLVEQPALTPASRLDVAQLDSDRP